MEDLEKFLFFSPIGILHNLYPNIYLSYIYFFQIRDAIELKEIVTCSPRRERAVPKESVESTELPRMFYLCIAL